MSVDFNLNNPDGTITSYHCLEQIATGHRPWSLYVSSVWNGLFEDATIALADANGTVFRLRNNEIKSWEDYGTGKPCSIYTHVFSGKKYLVVCGPFGNPTQRRIIVPN